MSFKINNLGARILKVERISASEQIVTIVVLLAILSVFTYPMYCDEINIYLFSVVAIKLVLIIAILFDLYVLSLSLVNNGLVKT